MDALYVLFEFLHGLLPADTASAVLALVPVILAVVSLLKMIPAIEEAKKWAAPLISVGLGLIGGFAVAPGEFTTALMAGLLAGLAAIGGFSGVKNTREAARDE